MQVWQALVAPMRGKIDVHGTVGHDSNRDRHPVTIGIVTHAVMPGFVIGCGIAVRSMCTRCASCVRSVCVQRGVASVYARTSIFAHGHLLACMVD